ncbi:MAG: 3-dehydroquinate dehydratase [Chlorobiaceae bacterium]|nr:3-dehydroquinate dehydratase [Chlorobiaceae bacterium]
MKKILVINGPNLNLLAKRNSDEYGNLDLEKIETLLRDEFKNFDFELFQSNHEGAIIEKIQLASTSHDGVIINPGGYSHTSVAIKDALEICKIPKIEVHLSHLANREEYRQTLITAKSCDGYVSGFKEYSYLAAAYLLNKLINGAESD